MTQAKARHRPARDELNPAVALGIHGEADRPTAPVNTFGCVEAINPVPKVDPPLLVLGLTFEVLKDRIRILHFKARHPTRWLDVIHRVEVRIAPRVDRLRLLEPGWCDAPQFVIHELVICSPGLVGHVVRNGAASGKAAQHQQRCSSTSGASASAIDPHLADTTNPAPGRTRQRRALRPAPSWAMPSQRRAACPALGAGLGVSRVEAS